MNRKMFLALSLCLMTLGASAQTSQLFDNGWKFTHEGKTISVDLPHDWAISYASDPTAETMTPFSI